MTDHFLKSNPKLDEVINSSGNFEAMREQMLSVLAEQGTVVRDRQDAYNVRVIVQPQQAASQPASDAAHEDHNKCFRVIYPSGNNRCELFGATEPELDATEAKIRAMFHER